MKRTLGGWIVMLGRLRGKVGASRLHQVQLSSMRVNPNNVCSVRACVKSIIRVSSVRDMKRAVLNVGVGGMMLQAREAACL